MFISFQTEIKENMINQETLSETKAKKQRVDQDLSLKCEQVASQLRIIGDNLEKSFSARHLLQVGAGPLQNSQQKLFQSMFMVIMEVGEFLLH